MAEAPRVRAPATRVRPPLPPQALLVAETPSLRTRQAATDADVAKVDEARPTADAA